MNIKKGFLIFACLAVTPIALLYGIAPDWFARTFLGMPQIDRNIAHTRNDSVFLMTGHTREAAVDHRCHLGFVGWG